MTLFLLGVTSTMAARPWTWNLTWDRINRWLSKGAKPKGMFEGRLVTYDRLLHGAPTRQAPAWGRHTAAFHALMGVTWAPEELDEWGVSAT